MNQRYPIGTFDVRAMVNKEDRDKWILEIERLPQLVREAVVDMGDRQLDTPYREGGWTVRQVVHHLPDSHLNAYLRLKLALTENEPTIKVYREDEWAKLEDSKLPVVVSLELLSSVHTRMVTIFHSLTEEQWQRSFIHPDLGKIKLSQLVGLYAWHGNHHLAHIRLNM